MNFDNKMMLLYLMGGIIISIIVVAVHYFLK